MKGDALGGKALFLVSWAALVMSCTATDVSGQGRDQEPANREGNEVDSADETPNGPANSATQGATNSVTDGSESGTSDGEIQVVPPPVTLSEGGLVRGGNHPPEGVIDEVNHFFESAFMGWPPTVYALDPRPRFADEIPEGTRFECSSAETVRYRGTTIRYRPAIVVHSEMIPRLQRFEALLAELGQARFGRAPSVIHHRGGYNCRTARGRRARISEHAYGNALDLQAVEFPALPREVREFELPRHLQRSFRATILTDWSSRRRRVQMQRAFLHELTDTLRGRPDIFRGIVGPPRPRHHDHLHLDVAPWRYALYAYEQE